MEWKYLHEHHNRQDKSRKPSYRQDFRENRPHSTGKPGVWNLVWQKNRFVWAVNPRVEALDSKHKLIEEFRKNARLQPFIIDGHKFKFGWNLGVFARKNDLPINIAQSVFDSVCTQARGRLEIVIRRMQRASLERKPTRQAGTEYISLPCDLERLMPIDRAK